MNEKLTNFGLWLVKFGIFLIISYNMGLIKGFIISLILHSIYSFLVNKILGIEELSAGDLNFVCWDTKKQYNNCIALIYEGKGKEKIKEKFIENGVKFFKKLRQKIIFTLGNFYWKECSAEEASQQIKFINNNVKLNTNDEIRIHLEHLVKQPFHINEFQFRVFIGENDNDQTIFILQSDHSLTDGLGSACLLSKLADNFNIENFPKIKEKDIWKRIKNKILIPFLIPFVLYKVYMTRSGESPFKAYKEFTGEKKSAYSQLYNFKDLYKVSKNLGVTFNDYILAIITAASKKYAKALGYDNLKTMTCIVPVNLRKMPKNEKDMVLTNEASGAMLQLDYMDHPTKEAHKVKAKTEFLVRNHLFTETLNLLNSLSNVYLPFFLNRKVITNSAVHFDFVISNVPGPTEPIYTAGLKLTKNLIVANPGPHSCFIVIYSYLNKTRLGVTVDSSIVCNENDFMKHIEFEINHSLDEINIKQD
jgi:hypothetical protein